MASERGSRTAVQKHTAAGQFEGTNVGNAETQFASALPLFMATRTVPIAVGHERQSTCSNSANNAKRVASNVHSL
jgi:hypothetical protein